MPTATGHTAAIRARKVHGTDVTDRSGKKIGEIEDLVLDKLSNNIMFAVVSFGGFLGIWRKVPPDPLVLAQVRQGEGQLCRRIHEGATRGGAGGVARRTRSQ